MATIFNPIAGVVTILAFLILPIIFITLEHRRNSNLCFRFHKHGEAKDDDTNAAAKHATDETKEANDITDEHTIDVEGISPTAIESPHVSDTTATGLVACWL